jgi:hypothetical protein
MKIIKSYYKQVTLRYKIKMKIVDYGYLIPSIIIIVGIPLLLYIKVAQHPTRSLDLTIYGSTIETALLAYYIDKNI